MRDITTFIIPSCGRDTLKRAIDSTAPHQYLHLLDEDRVGPSIIRNLLVRQAETEWISFLDDDDTVTPDYVARLEEEIAAHPEADVIHFREYFLRTGQVFPNWPEVAWGNVGISFSMKREVALKNPFRTEPYEDFELMKRLEEAGYNIFFSKYLTYHERH